MWKAIVSGLIIGALFMFSTAVGVNAVLNNGWLEFLFGLLGGAVGTYIAMFKEHRNAKRYLIQKDEDWKDSNLSGLDGGI
jgi:hypothetical protein